MISLGLTAVRFLTSSVGVNIKLVRYLAGLQEEIRTFRLDDFPADFYSLEDLYALRDMGYLVIHESPNASGKMVIDGVDVVRDIRPRDFEGGHEHTDATAPGSGRKHSGGGDA